MPIGILFWVIMIIWFLFGLYSNRSELIGCNFLYFGGNLILFVLLALLGWQVFGAVIK
jgi:hypothetical protein